MIYFCADDYGLSESVSAHIRQCVNEGVLNKVSVFPNFDKVDLSKISENKKIRLSLHLNLVEGRCMANPCEIPLLAAEDGKFKNTFTGLFALWLLKGKKLREEAYKEIKAQVLYWMNILPEKIPFTIDSHQHTHMIPPIFDAMAKVLEDLGLSPEYVRIPSEPIAPFIKTPSLYFTYSPVNIIKQWLLKFLYLLNKSKAKNFPTALFLGILFSGKMDEKRVRKALGKYISLAEKKKCDIEVLFHPGYLTEGISDAKEKNIVFESFYLSEERKTEFDSAMNIKERSVK